MPHTRTITSCGRSLAICIPQEYLDKLELKKGDTVYLDIHINFRNKWCLYIQTPTEGRESCT